MRIVNVHAARTNLSRLIKEAANGEEFIIAKAGKPVLNMVPLTTKEKPPRAGSG